MDKHFIVLNGKRYDAVTGALLGAHTESLSRSKRAAHTPAKSVHVPRINTVQSHQVTHTPVQKTPQAAHVAPAPVKKARDHHSAPQHINAHKPQSAKTLMRRVVKKPAEKSKVAIKQQYPVIKTESGITVEAPKRLAHQVDTSRLSRAQEVSQSHHVGRFQAHALKPIAPKVAHVAVAEAPAHHAQPTTTPKPHVRSHVRPHTAHAAHTAAQPRSQQVKPAKTDIFEQALADAKSHEEKSPKSHHRRWLSATAALGAILVLGGFVAFLNRSAIELQFASVRAGFAATMPTYVPDGFARQDTKAEGDKVTIGFTSPINSQGFTVSQERSNWDSQTLFDSVVSKSGTSYQVVQNGGLNIYIYEDSEAAWVDGGVLYKISGNADLDSDQIISIASSI